MMTWVGCALLSMPALLLASTAPVDGPPVWTTLWWAGAGAALGGYCLAGWEVITLLVSTSALTAAVQRPWSWWIGLALLRLTVGFGLGLLGGLLVAVFLLKNSHPLGVFAIGGVCAQGALLLKPAMDRMLERKLQRLTALLDPGTHPDPPR